MRFYLFVLVLSFCHRIYTYLRDAHLVAIQSTAANAFALMTSNANEHALVVALRLLLIRSVELISGESDRNQLSSRHSLFLSTTIFADVVDAARQHLSPMQFASLFLGIGRQIEPSYLPHLFPLPYDGRTSNKLWHQCRSVEDLFLNSIRNGSISLPSSALPLFSSKNLSLKMCGSLLSHCLVTFEANAESPKSTAFDFSVEERRLMRGIFRFGVKMEDSASMPHLDRLDDRDPLRVLDEINGDSETHSSESSSDLDDERRGLIVTTQRNSSRICQFFSPSVFFSKYKRPKEEEEIFEAASSFIMSGFSEIAHDFEFSQNGQPVTDHNDNDPFNGGRQGQITMAGIVASFLLPLMFAPEKRWQRIFVLAQILLGDNNVDRDPSVFPKMDEFVKLADTLSLKAIVTSLQAQVPSLKKQLSPTENEKCLVHLFKRLLVECERNISSSRAVTVLRLVLILLARHNIGQDINASIPGLLLLGVITTHCAGYTEALMEVNPRNVIMSAYFAALNELK